MQVKIVCDNKYLPVYANDTDGCMDLKSCGDYTILPHTMVVINSGVQVGVPMDYVMLMFVRSSMGIKHGCTLANGTGVIDAGYRDEIKIALFNNSYTTVKITDGERVAQFMVIPRPKIELVQVEDNEEFRTGDRLGGIGSSGRC